MFFWKKSEEVLLEFFTCNQYVHEFFKIKPSTFHFPSWWRNLPVDKYPTGKIRFDDGLDNTNINMKHCKGFTELYKRSLTLPMWCELEIKITESGYEWVSNSVISVAEHPSTQFTGLQPDYKFFHLKIDTPWAMYNKKSKIDVLLIDNFFNKPSPLITVTPGIINGNLRQQINVNVFAEHTNPPRLVNYSLNEPLVHIIPLTDKKIKLKHHLIDEKEYKALCGYDGAWNLNRKGVVQRKISEFAELYNSTLKK